MATPIRLLQNYKVRNLLTPVHIRSVDRFLAAKKKMNQSLSCIKEGNMLAT